MVNLSRFILGASLVVVLSGCAAVIRPVRDAISPPGQMNADGTINPCHGYRSNYEACGAAIYNGSRIGKVTIGQTLSEVRSIMGREPEKRSIRLDDAGRTVEAWSFLTNYDNSITTHIQFLNQRVVAIKEEQS
jgi:hypothetical protein